MANSIIPGPKTLNPLGAMLDFQRNPVELMMSLHRRYGQIVQFPGPVGMRIVSAASPDSIRDVLVTNAETLIKPPAFKKVFESTFGNGLFFSEGNFWKRQRKLSQPAFHHGRISMHTERMLHHIEHTIEGWQGQESISLNKQMRALTLSIVVDAIFHADISGETGQIFDAMHQLGEAVGKQVSNPLMAALPDSFPLPVLRQKRAASQALDTHIYRFIREHREAAVDRGDLISSLILAEDADTGERMSDQQLHDEVMTLFIAGHETSASVLAAIFVELARNPDAEAALHAEVDAVLGGRLPAFDDLARLPFTKQVVKEGLRMYPAAWILLRQATAPVEIGGYALPTGTHVWVSPYVIQRDPAYYDQPDTFRPERWTAEFEDSLPRYANIPFGAGPRICLGNGFAMLELQLIVAAIASRFCMRLPSGYIPEWSGATTLTLIGDVPVRLEARVNQAALIAD
jgi:cytochrome P450